MADRLYIGIDSGTQGTKAVVLSEKAGQIIAESYRGYALIENNRGGREQHPDIWIQACKDVIREVLENPDVRASDVLAIGVSGQQHGMVPLDSAGQIIRPAKLWCDTETTSQCTTITKRVGGEARVLEEVGNQIAAGFTASKILWLQEEEPKNYDRLATVLLPHDYINFWLTGEKLTECGDASGTAYFDVVNRRWSGELLTAIDPSGRLKECLPGVIPSSDPVGTIRTELAKELNLPREVLVSSGGGDNMMAAIGTGNITEGVVTASLGTSGTIYAYADKPVIDKTGELAAFCSSTGGWLPLVCTMNVTVATELVRNLLGLNLTQMNQMAASVKPGAGGLILLPYFNGERTPALPSAKATLAGMSPMNMRGDLICRAAMEGATFGLRYGLDVIRRNGIDPKEIRLAGGGSKSALWRQIVADTFNCEVVCLEQEEAGAVGAALQALWCAETDAGVNTSLQKITSRFVKLDESSRCEPQPSAVSIYDAVYEKYLSYNRALVPTYGND
jgi:xylulokinase